MLLPVAVVIAFVVPTAKAFSPVTVVSVPAALVAIITEATIAPADSFLENVFTVKVKGESSTRNTGVNPESSSSPYCPEIAKTTLVVIEVVTTLVAETVGAIISEAALIIVAETIGATTCDPDLRRVVAETTFALTLPDAVILVAEIVVAEIDGVWILEVAVTVAPVKAVAETVPEIPRFPESSRYTDFSAGYPQKTTLVPAARSMAAPALEDARMVSRDRVVPAAV
jgi:hypothetical protein